MTAPTVPRSFAGAPLEMWTIYRFPPDYPGKIVVRRWFILDDPGRGICKGTCDASPHFVGVSLHDARTSVPAQADVCLHRSPDDDPTIVETWL